LANFTKQAIRASFIKLLNLKPLDKITVKDIVEDCEINRNTFYYHYQDVFALLKDVFEEEAQSCDFGSITPDNWNESFAKGIDFVIKNKKAVYHVLRSSKKEYFDRYLSDVTEKYIRQFVQAQAEGLRVSERDMNLIIVFYKCAFMGVVVEWLLADMKSDPVEGINRLGGIFGGSIRSALERAAKKP